MFYADDLGMAQRKVLGQFVDDPTNLPRLGVKMFPPPMRLKLYSRSEFIEGAFWKSIRRGAMTVGFNLPFDLSRLAVSERPDDRASKRHRSPRMLLAKVPKTLGRPRLAGRHLISGRPRYARKPQARLRAG